MGIFDLIHRYLGIVKSFQTLHVHMNNAGARGYKTGTFITKKKFSKLFITVNRVYMHIYDVPKIYI